MKKIVVLGGGESGVGAAILAQKKGHPVFLSDRGALKEEYRKELEAYNIPYEENYHTIEKLYEADLIVKSPGIPDNIEVIRNLQSNGIPVISEIEFAGKHTNSVVIGITGSNGKTTTTSLSHHLLEIGGIDVAIGGNIGCSFARLVAKQSSEVYVLELSSFQLDGIKYFQPDVSVLLNITPDHLDRYDYKMENYVASKFRILQNQEEEDVFIYNADDERIAAYLTKQEEMLPQAIAISTSLYQDGWIVLGENLRFDMRECSLRGPHNMFNAACAIQVALSQGVKVEDIQKGLNTYVNVPHRLELVREVEGVEYINDSKATNIDAVYHALLAMKRPTVLVLGGVDKGNDYEVLAQLVSEKVKALVCLGLDNEKIKAFFKDKVADIFEASSMKEAIHHSQSVAEKGDTVLLSPACASFDLFKNYEDRGNQFKMIVNKL